MAVNSRDLPLTSARLSGHQRVKVDADQTHFWEGRGYRTFKELSIGAGATYTIRVVVPANVVLHYLDLSLDEGAVKLSTLAGGTAAGTWAETLPVFKTNNMAVGPDRLADRANTTVVTAGGTVTGSTVLDVVRVKTAGATGQAITVGNSASDSRGIAPGTYYFQFLALGSGAVTGTFKVAWEERNPE